MSKSRLTFMVRIIITASMILLGDVAVTFAQDSCPLNMTKLSVGESVIGRIGENTPVVLYCFEGRTGEQVTVDLSRDSGSLDPLLEITNIDGDHIFAMNDDRSLSSTDSQIVFIVPDTSAYVIHATRLEREEGSTQGTYELTMTSNLDQGNDPLADKDDTARPKGCPILYDSIRYGETIKDVIDDENFSYYFCFSGERGDEVVIDAIGDDTELDTVLLLTDLRFEDVLAENDDIRLGNRDSRIVYILPDSGAYLITVARYNFENGTTEGNFTLTLTLNDGTIPDADFADGQAPQPYECNRPLIQQLNATQWLEKNSDYSFRLNFGCEGLAVVSVLGGIFTTPYSYVDGNLQVVLDNHRYRVALETDGILTLTGEANEFVFNDDGDCSDSIVEDLIEGVWFLDENTTFFRLDFMCNDVVLITVDSLTEVHSYHLNTDTDVLTIGTDEPFVWTDVFILPGSFMSVETEEDPIIFTNILVEIEDVDEADI